MTKQDYITLMDSLYPHFFEKDNIRSLPEEWTCAELVLPLNEFDPSIYDKKLDDSISFGYYDGNLEELREAVAKVVRHWADYYTEDRRIYCGYVDGKVASFCLVENKGDHCVNGRTLKIGGPGCVGTLPEYRDKGIGLTMVKHVTRILKEEGYDYSYIHFTGVAPWYEKLGYQISVTWNRNGII